MFLFLVTIITEHIRLAVHVPLPSYAMLQIILESSFQLSLSSAILLNLVKSSVVLNCFIPDHVYCCLRQCHNTRHCLPHAMLQIILGSSFHLSLSSAILLNLVKSSVVSNCFIPDHVYCSLLQFHNVRHCFPHMQCYKPF